MEKFLNIFSKAVKVPSAVMKGVEAFREEEGNLFEKALVFLKAFKAEMGEVEKEKEAVTEKAGEDVQKETAAAIKGAKSLGGNTEKLKGKESSIFDEVVASLSATFAKNIPSEDQKEVGQDLEALAEGKKLSNEKGARVAGLAVAGLLDLKKDPDKPGKQLSEGGFVKRLEGFQAAAVKSSLKWNLNTVLSAKFWLPLKGDGPKEMEENKEFFLEKLGISKMGAGLDVVVGMVPGVESVSQEMAALKQIMPKTPTDNILEIKDKFGTRLKKEEGDFNLSPRELGFIVYRLNDDDLRAISNKLMR